MELSPSAILQIVVLIFGVGSVYGLIRADIRHIHEKFSDVKEDIGSIKQSTTKAHERIDTHVATYHIGKN